MIARLRSVHSGSWTALALLLPALLGAALVARPRQWEPAASPAAASLAAIAASARERGAVDVGAARVDWALAADGTCLALAPAGDPGLPDLLLYLAGANAESTAAKLPVDARFLGRLDGARALLVALPPGAADQSGTVSFFSLGHQRVAARFGWTR